MLRQSSWLRKTRPEEFLKYGLVDEHGDITPPSPKTQALEAEVRSGSPTAPRR
jgi:hypothetical protein